MAQRFEGRNLEEALQTAAQTLGVERWQLTYHVLLEKRGFLGGVKRLVIEADVNAAAPPPPAPLAPLPRYEDAPSSPQGEGGRGGRGRGSSDSSRGPAASGGGRGGDRGGRGRGGSSRSASGSRDASGSTGRGGSSRGRGRGRGPRDREDELQPGDFEQFLDIEIPEQGAESEQAQLVRSWCGEVLSRAKLDVTLRSEENETQVIVRLYGRDTGRLVDRHGELLDAVQVLANKALVGRKVEKEIELDCTGFKDRRVEEIGQRARDAANRVRNGGREELLEAMTPIERRIVHLALQEDAEVTTESRGDGFYKRVAIIRRPVGEAVETRPTQES